MASSSTVKFLFFHVSYFKWSLILKLSVLEPHTEGLSHYSHVIFFFCFKISLLTNMCGYNMFRSLINVSLAFSKNASHLTFSCFLCNHGLLLKQFTHRYYRSCPSCSDGGGVCVWRLPVGGTEAAVWNPTREPVLHSGLQRSQEEPGPEVPHCRGSSALGARSPHVKGASGQNESEGKTGPISCPISNMLE